MAYTSIASSCPANAEIKVDAVTLHRQISACRWSLTKKDLQTFRSLVVDAINNQQIVPTQLDDFDPSYLQCGPNMYTVTEQFIKPITLAAGGMSWALMLHPQGLKCDMFVSHAWQEGVLELVDTLLNAWEHGLKHAWCCAFANPQNLDIGFLISNPESSPFAVALGNASHVVVVTNSAVSVYTRLWCVYEAYLAYRSDKTILVAHASIRGTVLASLPRYLMYFAAAYVLGIFVLHGQCLLLRTQKMFLSLFFALLAGSVFVPAFWWRVVNLLSMVLLGFDIAMLQVARPVSSLIIEYVCDGKEGSAHDERTDTLYALMTITASLIFLVTLVLSEIDRVRYDALDRVASQLRLGYTGSVRDAKCSSPLDRERIISAIGQEIREVDQTVQVLMKSGMSTQRLREAEGLGVKMEATRWRFALTFLLFALNLKNVFIVVFVCVHWTDIVISRVLLNLLPLVWAGVYFRLRVDGRAFALLVTNKLQAISLLGQVFVRVADRKDPANTAQLVGHIFVLLSILLAIAGIDGIARIPGCGQILARLVVGQSLQDVADPLAKPSLADKESTDEDEACFLSSDSE